jgi:hypothetical protein
MIIAIDGPPERQRHDRQTRRAELGFAYVDTGAM